MTHTAREFSKQAIPISQFLKTISEGYYWSYEFHRDQYMNIENSVAPKAEIDSANQMVWNINLAEANGKSDVGRLKDHIIYATIEQAVDNRDQLLNFFRRRSGSDRRYKEMAFRNLTNAWRDEYCLSSPVDAGPEERMKTAECRITMCYYALYKSVSAIIHTKDDSNLSNSHQKTLNEHSNQFMASRARCLYGYPFNFKPSSGNFFNFRKPFPYFIGVEEEAHKERLRRSREEMYAEQHKRLMEALYRKSENISTWNNERNSSTFYHLFKLLREWANYEHGGIFSRLYGPGYIKFIDRALRLITYSAISTAEVALICAFGIDEYEQELNQYCNSCREGVSEGDIHVTNRNMIYQRALGDF